MKRIFSFFIAAALSLPAVAQLDRSIRPQAGPARPIEIGSYETFELKNGLKVIVVENHKLPRVTFSLVLNNTPVSEGNKQGYVEFTGDLLRRGTTTRTKDQLDAEIDFMGANVGTSSRGAFATSLSKYTEKTVELLADMVINPSFPQEELDKLIKQSESGLLSIEDDPGSVMNNLASVVLYGKNHPYGEIMTEESLKAITLDDCKQYYSTYFRPNVAYLAVVGDIKPKEAKKLVKKYFGDWKSAEVPANKPAFPAAPAKTEVALVHRASSVQSMIQIANVIDLKPGAEDVVTMSVLNQILGGGSSARLFQNLREDKAFTYGAYSSYDTDPYAGYFQADAEVRNAVTSEAVVEFFKEMNRMRNEKVTAEDLEATKAYLRGQFGRSLESPQTIANFALNIERYGLPKDYYKNYLKRLDAVTPEMVQAAANKYLRTDAMHILVVGNALEVGEGLAAFGKVTYYDAFGKVTEAPGIPIPEGVTAQTVVDKYLQAINYPAYAKMQDITISREATIQGFSLKSTEIYKAPNKFYQKQDMGPMGSQVRVYNGKTGKDISNGATQEISGEDLQDLAREGVLVEESAYASWGAELKLVGITKVNEENCYILEVQVGEEKTTHYYSVATGLKMRTTTTQMGPQGEMAVNVDYSGYTDYSGLKLPSSISIPAGPMKLEFKTTDVKVNSKVPDSQFN